MARRKEQKEALRRERQARAEAAKAAERRRRLIGYGVGGGLVLVALVIVAVLLLAGGGDKSAKASLLPDGGSVPEVKNTNLREAANAGACQLKSFRATSRDHTNDPAKPVKYPSNPPAAGRHYQFPADDDAYGKAPPDSEVVHAQEHGRVVIWFKPSLTDDKRADLKALYEKQQGYQLLLVPRRNMPYEVAETAWNASPEPLGTGRLLGCPTLGDKSWDALQDFIEDNRGSGPEPVP